MERRYSSAKALSPAPGNDMLAKCYRGTKQRTKNAPGSSNYHLVAQSNSQAQRKACSASQQSPASDSLCCQAQPTVARNAASSDVAPAPDSAETAYMWDTNTRPISPLVSNSVRNRDAHAPCPACAWFLKSLSSVSTSSILSFPTCNACGKHIGIDV
jgi:hypothetical protein